MTTLYKLTDANGWTRDNTQWGPGVEHTASGEGDLCGPGYLHAYTDPLLAELLSSNHVAFGPGRRLWKSYGVVGKTDCGLQVGCTRLRTVCEIPLPTVTPEQRVRFGILCAQAVYDDPKWAVWARNWLSGADRSERSALTAATGAADAAPGVTAAWTAACTAAWAARAATAAATGAAALAADAAAAAVVPGVVGAAVAAEWAAVAAAWAAWAGEFDLIALAHQALAEETVIR